MSVADPQEKSARPGRRRRIAGVVVGFFAFLLAANVLRLYCVGAGELPALRDLGPAARGPGPRGPAAADPTISPRDPLKGFAAPKPEDPTKTPEAGEGGGPEEGSVEESSFLRSLPPDIQERHRLRAAQAELANIEQAQQARMNRIYQTQCANCHGAGGKGRGPMAGQAPIDDLSDPTYWDSFDSERARRVILEGSNPNTGGLGVMPPFRGQLDENEVDQMIVYLRRFAAEKEGKGP